ncbi:MAG: hypothetical protein R3B99_31000 [Polyangiales bacterium]
MDMVKRIALFALIASAVVHSHFENVAALLAYNPSNPSGVTWDQTMVAVVDQGDAAISHGLGHCIQESTEFVRLDENGTQIGTPQNFPFMVRRLRHRPTESDPLNLRPDHFVRHREWKQRWSQLVYASSVANTGNRHRRRVEWKRGLCDH